MRFQKVKDGYFLSRCEIYGLFRSGCGKTTRWSVWRLVPGSIMLAAVGSYASAKAICEMDAGEVLKQSH